MPQEEFRLGDLVAYKAPVYADIYIGIVVGLKKSGVPWIKPLQSHGANNGFKVDADGNINTQSTVINLTYRLQKKGFIIESEFDPF